MQSTKPTGQLPKIEGLQVRRNAESLEAVTTKAAVLRLLVTGDMEIMEGKLGHGERLTFTPDSERPQQAVEAVYLLEGQLTNVSGDDSRGPLVAGDYVVTKGLREEAIFSALGEVRFLYFTSQPFFHQISGQLEELMRLAVEVEVTDGYTADHCVRLQRLSFATGQNLGLSSHRLHLLAHGAHLHDVGKVRVPAEILQKPGKLTADEWTIIKQHPQFGRELLESTFIRPAGPIVEQHHERLDGSGYPYGLSGDEILPESYIVAIADTYDAMTTDRVYRKALPAAEAEAELKKFAGIHYPRELVDAFLSSVRGIEPGEG